MEDPANAKRVNVTAQLEDLELGEEAEFDRDDWLDQQEPHMRQCLEELYTNQGEIDRLMRRLLQERREVDLKYQKLLGPHYNQRKQMIKGGLCSSNSGSFDVSVPGFWLKVLQSHGELEDRITSKDAEILEHLEDIRGTRFEEGADSTGCGYVVTFEFSPNTYFSEVELSVKVTFANEEETVIKAIEGTSISWSNKGADPTVKILSKKGSDGAQKMKLASVDSFFKLFQPIQPPINGNIGTNEYEDLKEEAEDCLAVLSLLMEEMIPHAMKYFSGEKIFDDEIDLDSEISDDDESAADDGQGPRGNLLQTTSTGKAENSNQHEADCKQQ